MNADTYANYFWVKGNYDGDVTVSLYGPSGTVYSSKTVHINSNSNTFSYCEATFTSSQSYESNNVWKVTFDASKLAGSSMNFALVQLFAVTYHAR